MLSTQSRGFSMVNFLSAKSTRIIRPFFSPVTGLSGFTMAYKGAHERSQRVFTGSEANPVRDAADKIAAKIGGGK